MTAEYWISLTVTIFAWNHTKLADYYMVGKKIKDTIENHHYVSKRVDFNALPDTISAISEAKRILIV